MVCKIRELEHNELYTVAEIKSTKRLRLPPGSWLDKMNVAVINFALVDNAGREQGWGGNAPNGSESEKGKGSAAVLKGGPHWLLWKSSIKVMSTA